MEEIKLDVQLREEHGRRGVNRIRKEGFLPAIVYGGDKTPTAIQLDRRTFERIRRLYHGELVFHLNVMQAGKKLRDYSAIVKEEQRHTVTNDILHLDFKRISLTEEMEFKVEIKTRGEPSGVKRAGGSLDHAMWELDIICLPTNIPQEILVDVSAMEIGDTVHVKDLILPSNVRTEHDPEAVVLTVVPPMKDEPTEAEEELTEAEVTEGEAPAEGEAAEGKGEGETEKGEKKPEEKKPEAPKDQKKEDK